MILRINGQMINDTRLETSDIANTETEINPLLTALKITTVALMAPIAVTAIHQHEAMPYDEMVVTGYKDMAHDLGTLPENALNAFIDSGAKDAIVDAVKAIFYSLAI